MDSPVQVQSPSSPDKKLKVKPDIPRQKKLSKKTKTTKKDHTVQVDDSTLIKTSMQEATVNSKGFKYNAAIVDPTYKNPNEWNDDVKQSTIENLSLSSPAKSSGLKQQRLRKDSIIQKSQRSLSVTSNSDGVQGMKIGRKNRFNTGNNVKSLASSRNSRYCAQLSPDKVEQDVSELRGELETSFLTYQMEINAMLKMDKIDLVLIGRLSLGDKMKYELMVQYFKNQQELQKLHQKTTSQSLQIGILKTIKSAKIQLDNKCDKLIVDNHRVRKSQDAMSVNIKELENKLSQITAELKDKTEKYEAEIKDKTEKYEAETKDKTGNYEFKIDGQSKENVELKQNLENKIILEQKLEKICIELNKKIESLVIDANKEEEVQPKSALESALTCLGHVEMRIDNLEKQNVMLISQCDKYIDVIKSKKFERIYFPKQGDAVDQALANFINTYPDRQKWEEMNVPFVHSSEGIYQCGSKRVHAKLNPQNGILIKNGANYINIEEFCENYVVSNKMASKRGHAFQKMDITQQKAILKVQHKQSGSVMKKKRISNLKNKENVKPNLDNKDIEFKDPIFEAFKTESQMTDTMIN